MKISNKLVKLTIFFGLLVFILMIPYIIPEALMLDELSEEHSSLDCDSCHLSWKGVSDSKCENCHDKQDIHIHNSTLVSDNCTSCHQMHKDEIKNVVDNCTACHSDSHVEQDIKELGCLDCHVGVDSTEIDYSHDISAVRKILRKDDHSEKKGVDCYTCHDEKKFDEYNCLTSDCHGTPKYDKEHREKASDWKTRDCFESGCHSKN